MRLVVGTSVLVGEPAVELPRRVGAFVRRRNLEPEVGRGLVAACAEAVEATVTVLDRAVYSAVETEARARVPRDEHDWPVVASAMVLAAGIWTHDHDFLGCGVPTWTTDTLSRWLSHG